MGPSLLRLIARGHARRTAKEARVLKSTTAMFLVMLLAFGFEPLMAYAAPAEEPYKPLFSEEVLSRADPESRARLEALNERNRQRWLDQRAGGGRTHPDPATSRPTTTGKRLYRVTDPDGTVRFSDQYVAGSKEVTVTTSKPSAASRAEHEARQQEQARTLEYFDQRNRQRQSEAAENQRRSAAAGEQKKRCHNLFLEIQDNRRGGFVSYDVGPNGDRIYLSDEELAKRTDGMEADYRKHCGELPPIAR